MIAAARGADRVADGCREHYPSYASMTSGTQDCIEQALAQLDQKMKVAVR